MVYSSNYVPRSSLIRLDNFFFYLLVCLSKYVGTFPVSLGSSSDGETTLITHKERTKFVKKKLREYRVRKH